MDVACRICVSPNHTQHATKISLTESQFGQELLSTFSTQIGEIALIPATGGLFTVELTYAYAESQQKGADVEIKKVLLWDRKAEGGFPETKVLKQLVRDHIDPGKDLGHSDRHGKKKEGKGSEEDTKGQATSQGVEERQSEALNQGEKADVKRNPDGTVCEDCK
ncbi:hypothetical protein K505DRAFT_238510 [Melanomma pulvis-pyrius CBS 109.77]|uniref:Rdx family-domain-containing protein n=1 Tax=Melanomma pulvis-pyrius CBS 109.77 TaxID=1314802 RepID=A0A6A6XI13_9PLEO|nr:hypothetical protein K505DRAFT_238510 [Melanomma pulvis-pyrius CBS 109.77]